MVSASKFSKSVVVIALIMVVALLAACSPAAATPAADSGGGDTAKPSNAGGPGPALQLTGDSAAGAKVFAENCVACHGEEGKGGVQNPGSEDGTVPALNPAGDDVYNKDAKVFLNTMDLFLEHGSKPAGDGPTLEMKAFGDQKLLTPQQIADVLAYIQSVNKK
jgi:mono/diheme cytochrome c family protein